MATVTKVFSIIDEGREGEDWRWVNFTELKQEITDIMLYEWQSPKDFQVGKRHGVARVCLLLGIKPYALTEEALKANHDRKRYKDIWDLEVF